MKKYLLLAMLFVASLAHGQATTTVACQVPLTGSVYILQPSGQLFTGNVNLPACVGVTACKVTVSPGIYNVYPGGQVFNAKLPDIAGVRDCTTDDTAASTGSGTVDSVARNSAQSAMVTANTATQTATAAQTAASTASQNASAAQIAANQAAQNAATALSTANAALPTTGGTVSGAIVSSSTISSAQINGVINVASYPGADPFTKLRAALSDCSAKNMLCDASQLSGTQPVGLVDYTANPIVPEINVTNAALKLPVSFNWPVILKGSSTYQPCAIRVTNRGDVTGGGSVAGATTGIITIQDASSNYEGGSCEGDDSGNQWYASNTAHLRIATQSANTPVPTVAMLYQHNLYDHSTMQFNVWINQYAVAGIVGMQQTGVCCGTSAFDNYSYASAGGLSDTTAAKYVGGTAFKMTGTNINVFDQRNTFNAPGMTGYNADIEGQCLDCQFNNYLEENRFQSLPGIYIASGAGLSITGGTTLSYCGATPTATCLAKFDIENHSTNFSTRGTGHQNNAYINDVANNKVITATNYNVGGAYSSDPQGSYEQKRSSQTANTGKQNGTWLIDNTVTSCTFPSGTYTDPASCAFAAASAAWDTTGFPQSVEGDAGVYGLNSPIVLTHPISFRGYGRSAFTSSNNAPSGGTVLRAMVPMQNMVSSVVGTYMSDLTWSGLTFDGNGNAQNGLYLPSIRAANLSNFAFMGMTGTKSWAQVGDSTATNGGGLNVHADNWFFYYPSGNHAATLTATTNADGTLSYTLVDGGQYRILYNAGTTVTAFVKSTSNGTLVAGCTTPPVVVGNLVSSSSSDPTIYTMGSYTVTTAAAGCPYVASPAVPTIQTLVFANQPQANYALIAQTTDSTWTNIEDEAVGKLAGIYSLGGVEAVWDSPHWWTLNIGFIANGNETIDKAENDSTFTAGVYVNNAGLAGRVNISNPQPSIAEPSTGLGSQVYVGSVPVVINPNAGIALGSVVFDGKQCMLYNSLGICTSYEQTFDAVTTNNPVKHPVSSFVAGAYGSIYLLSAVTPMQYGNGSFSNVYGPSAITNNSVTTACFDLPYYDAQNRIVRWDATGNIQTAGFITSGHTAHACWTGAVAGQTGKWNITTDAAPIAPHGQRMTAQGAFCDGTSHPVSSLYPTLAAAQVVYPTAAAVTDELDTLAFENARAVAGTLSTGHDEVYAPAGICLASRTLTIPVDAVQTIPSGSVMSLMGDGSNATVFQPTAAMLATGAPVLACGSGLSDTYANSQGRYSANGCSGHFQGFTVRSASNFVAAQYSGLPPTVNGVPVTGDGIFTGGRMNLTDVVVEGFVHGFNLVGDHELWTNVKGVFNQDGIYFAPQSQFLYGDLTWMNPILSANTRSAVFISKDAYASVTVEGQFYASGSPYGIRGEAGNWDYGSGYLPMLLNFHATNVLSEFLSNSWISDANMDDVAGGAASHIGRVITNSDFNNASIIGCTVLSYCTPLTSNNQGHFAWISVGGLEGVHLSLGSNGFAPETGMKAGIVTAEVGNNYGGFTLDLNPNLITSGYNNIPLFAGFIYGQDDDSCASVSITTRGQWSGTCIIYPTSGTYYTALTALPAGLVMRRFYEAMGVVNGQNDAFQSPAGVNMQPWTTANINGSATIIATHGLVTGVPYTGSISVGQLFQTAGSGGTLACSTGPSTPCSSGFLVGQVTRFNTSALTASIRLMLSY